jgi:6-phosphogluconolactonase (cycloisomerase 2 family)
VDDKKKFVFVGNYSGGNLLSIPLNADGSFRKDVQNIKHRKQRCKRPAGKSRMSTPLFYRRMIVIYSYPDLGADKVFQYRVDVTKPQALTPQRSPSPR